MIRQMDFFSNIPMGFDKDAIVNIEFPTDSIALTRMDYVRNRLSALKDVLKISFNSGAPADEGNNWSTVTFDHAGKKTTWYSITKFADSNYISTYSIPLVAGTNFRANDSVAEFLVSEDFVRSLGFAHPQEVLNKEMNLWGPLDGRVVGVMKEFHATSLKDGIIPVIITKFKRVYWNAGLKLSGENIPATLAAVEKIWNAVFPNNVFEYQFLDQHIAEFYKQERQLSQIYKFFAAIAIFLSCLGLYGLASFMAAQRIKEIGIRKVLGASARGIVVLFSREFMVLIGIAYLIAAPLAGWYMYSWLQSFKNQVTLSWWIFAAGGLISVLIALATVSSRALRAARANPVQALKAD
jgi:hypothetical protein